jgi:uncharacterized protein (TIGR03084 family)
VREGRFTAYEALAAAGSLPAFEEQHLARGRGMAPAQVRAWWLETCVDLAAALDVAPEEARIPWGPNRMSVSSFTTARLMETWAHGLDCFDAVGVAPTDTDRLRHVALLGLRTLPYAFAVQGLPAPGPVRLELMAPDGATMWRLGAEDAPSLVSGSAGDWCRAAVRRDRRGERDRLTAAGPDGLAVVAHVQAYLAA